MKKDETKLTKGERKLYFAGGMSLLITMVVNIFLGANIGNLSIKVEMLKYEKENHYKTNESLTMKVNELTSFSKVNNIVKEMGLVYNYKNIVNINE